MFMTFLLVRAKSRLRATKYLQKNMNFTFINVIFVCAFKSNINKNEIIMRGNYGIFESRFPPAHMSHIPIRYIDELKKTTQKKKLFPNRERENYEPRLDRPLYHKKNSKFILTTLFIDIQYTQPPKQHFCLLFFICMHSSL